MQITRDVRNVNRTVGAMLSGEIAKAHGHDGLPTDTIRINLTGVAGQSFGAWLAHGVTLDLTGDANDYVGKGLSGGRIIVRQPSQAPRAAQENIIVGNTVLYGAIAGEAYFDGVAGERFAVRNSGAIAVVEGTGDHGCEYMTGGVVVVLGQDRAQFRGGHDRRDRLCLRPRGRVRGLCNPAQVDLLPISAGPRCRRWNRPPAAASAQRPRYRHGRYAAPRCRAAAHAGRTPPAPHRQHAGGRIARRLGRRAARFVKVMPRDYAAR